MPALDYIVRSLREPMIIILWTDKHMYMRMHAYLIYGKTEMAAHDNGVIESHYATVSHRFLLNFNWFNLSIMQVHFLSII